jgi:serine protease Do
MTSLLLTMLTLAAVAFQAPAAAPQPAKKPKDRVVATAPVKVKSYVIGSDGEMLDDHGIVFVQGRDGQAGPLQLLDLLGPRRYIGVHLITLTPELRRHFGVPADRGVMVSKVVENTPAAAAGIEVGDVLMTADGSPVVTAGDVTHVLAGKQTGEEIRIELWRDGRQADLAVAYEEGTEMALTAGPQGAANVMLLRDGRKVPLDARALADKAIAIRAVRQEDLDDAMRAVDQYLQSGEWQERVKQLQTLDLDQVQQRMKALERRLQELERELAEKRR